MGGKGRSRMRKQEKIRDRKKREDANGIMDDNGTFSGSSNESGRGEFMKNKKLEERSKERSVYESTAVEKQYEIMDIGGKPSDDNRSGSVSRQICIHSQGKTKKERETKEPREGADHSTSKRTKKKRRKDTNGVVYENAAFSENPNELRSGGSMKKRRLEERSKESKGEESTSVEKQNKTMVIGDKPPSGDGSGLTSGESAKLSQEKTKVGVSKEATEEEDHLARKMMKRKSRKGDNGLLGENASFSGSLNELGSGRFMKKRKLDERSNVRSVDEKTSAKKQHKRAEIVDELSHRHRSSSIVTELDKVGKVKTQGKRVSNESREGCDPSPGNMTKKKNMKQENLCGKDSPVSKENFKKQDAFLFDKSLPDDGGCSEPPGDFVMGKRYTDEEDAMIRRSISDYIKEHDLGADGLEKVLNCKKYPEVRKCWPEIAARLPWRPYKSIYIRAHVLYQRSDERKWTDEERDAVLRFVAVHGRKWKALGDELGKHRFHVKDLWRRIKLSSYRKGPWSQHEYQQLFDLVNLDLQVKAFEEKKTKYGMLRDNISWEAISDKLTTRNQTTCCLKWYNQLASPLVKAGFWANGDDYRLLARLLELDSHNVDDVDWDNLFDNRPGELCRRRWCQMVKHIGENRAKSFLEQVQLLASRYCPKLIEK